MIFLILFCSLICIIDYIRNRQFFTPIFIFNSIWAVTLGLYSLQLSELQHNLSQRTILIFWICVLAYNCAVVLANYIIEKAKNKNGETTVEKEIDQNKVDRRIKIAKIIAIIIFIIEIIYSQGVPLIWKLIGSSKTYFDFGIPSINGALYGLIIFLGTYSIVTKTKDRYLYLLIGILIISRQIILSIIIQSIVCLLLPKKWKISKTKLVILIIVVVIGFGIFGNFRSGSSTMDRLFNAKEQYENIPTTVKWIYSYMTFSITNFDNLVGMTNGAVNYGASILSEILPTVIRQIVNIKPNYTPYYLELINFNVSTYLPAIYLDFGPIGIYIFNILIGAIASILYYNVQRTNENKDTFYYSIIVHNIFLLFFVNMFLHLPIMVQFVYIFIIYFGTSKVKMENEESINDGNMLAKE